MAQGVGLPPTMVAETAAPGWRKMIPWLIEPNELHRSNYCCACGQGREREGCKEFVRTRGVKISCGREPGVSNEFVQTRGVKISCGRGRGGRVV